MELLEEKVEKEVELSDKPIRYNAWWDLLRTISSLYGKEKVKDFAKHSGIKDHDELIRQKEAYQNSRNNSFYKEDLNTE